MRTLAAAAGAGLLAPAVVDRVGVVPGPRAPVRSARRAARARCLVEMVSVLDGADGRTGELRTQEARRNLMHATGAILRRQGRDLCDRLRFGTEDVGDQRCPRKEVRGRVRTSPQYGRVGGVRVVDGQARQRGQQCCQGA